VQITAYTGGVMSVGGFGAVVIELKGLELPDKIPLLEDHANVMKSIVGHGKPETFVNEVIVAGHLTDKTEAGKRVIDLGNDLPLQASVGVEVFASRRVGKGEKVKVNGTAITAPEGGLRIITKGRLREVSITPMGADQNTAVHIAANQQRLNSMADDIDTEDVLQKERARIRKIEATCRGTEWGKNQDKVNELKAKAVDEDISFEELQRELLGIMRASRTHVFVAHAGNGPTDQARTLEAALCLSAGLPEDFVGEQCGYDERTMNAAVSKQYKGVGIHDALRFVCREAGQEVPHKINAEAIRHAFRADGMLQAQFSTTSLPGMLSNVANKVLLKSYLAVNRAGLRLCKPGDAQDFKTFTRYRMTMDGALEQVGNAGELKHTTLSEQGFDHKIDTWGRIISLPRQTIINDDMGGFLQIPQMLGRQSALSVEEIIFTRLLSNQNNFFHADHANYITGAGTALSISAITELEQKFLDQTDAAGKPILITPKILLVPTALNVLASSIVRSVNVQVTTTADKLTPAGNPHSGRFESISSPYLSNANIHANASSKAWYLFGDPNDVAALVIDYLQGQQQPHIESGETDFNTLGMQWRCFFDFGVAFEDWRAAAKAKGEA
jgi:hypothetical protein